jgi:hypothetical protein
MPQTHVKITPKLLYKKIASKDKFELFFCKNYWKPAYVLNNDCLESLCLKKGTTIVYKSNKLEEAKIGTVMYTLDAVKIAFINTIIESTESIQSKEQSVAIEDILCILLPKPSSDKLSVQHLSKTYALYCIHNFQTGTGKEYLIQRNVDLNIILRVKNDLEKIAEKNESEDYYTYKILEEIVGNV